MGKSNPEYIREEENFLYYFKPFENLEEFIERNAFQAIRLSSEKNHIFTLILTCGTEDWLFDKNKRFLKQLEEDEVSLTYMFFSGFSLEIMSVL